MEKSRYKATYHQNGHGYGQGHYVFTGVVIGSPKRDQFGNSWVYFVTDTGVVFGSVLLCHTVIGEQLPETVRA